jgi:hypothetical protein
MHFKREPGLEVIVNTTEVAQRINVTGRTILLESANGSELEDGVLSIASDTTVWLER